MDYIDRISKYLKAIDDPTRLRIIELLNKGNPVCVNHIAHELNLTQSAISQHLRILKQLNLVIGNKMGNHIHYKINNDELTALHALLSKIIYK